MQLPFELDPQIIHHIIYSQAGSIGKALIELLMNSVDAGATQVKLVIDRTGFSCVDDGRGFASQEEVKQYFGRFGTPHKEGDATYGRFRLGRGQIMAHASTVWNSSRWQMTVDTRVMGYSYDFEELPTVIPGCSIVGKWYEPLTDTELMSALQEVRDLVRYTPIVIDLNERVITRNPQKEKWDAEDEFAYYRVKEEGAVSIYNQGVLVRHDPGHMWGAGGLIVTKQAIALNVSRTEILRKTCPIWRSVAKQFKKMADEIASRLGDNRKTEARREKSARALLSGDADIISVFQKEEVVTVLPGKRHLPMIEFLRRCYYSHDRYQSRSFTVVENSFDIPKGEAIAREGIAIVVHPHTLDRFGAYSASEFRDCIARINAAYLDARQIDDSQFWGTSYIFTPDLLDFGTLREAFIDRTCIVSEKECLDKETRRAWTALRWCLAQYASLSTGGEGLCGGRSREGKRFHILLGESNRAEAWTDGETYIAVDVTVVRRLRSDALRTVSYIFSLVEHEIAHEGDSLECGHDEAFYQRFHDIVVRYAEERQRYMHLWLMKYTQSMEMEGKRNAGRSAWRERYLIDQAGSGRIKRGLPAAIDDLSGDPVLTLAIPDENLSLATKINTTLRQAGHTSPPPNWLEVIAQAKTRQDAIDAQQREEVDLARKQAEEFDQWWQEEIDVMRKRAISLLKVDPEEITKTVAEYLVRYGADDDDIRRLWEQKLWEGGEPEPIEYEDYDYGPDPNEDVVDEKTDHGTAVARYGNLVRPGETECSLERNAAAAGFLRIEDYLQWRSGQE